MVPYTCLSRVLVNFGSSNGLTDVVEQRIIYQYWLVLINSQRGGNHIQAISLEMPKISITEICFEITATFNGDQRVLNQALLYNNEIFRKLEQTYTPENVFGVCS